MPNFDVIELYKKGFSINQIIDLYYRWKTKEDLPNRRKGNVLIITKKTITKENAKNDVYKQIYFYNLKQKNAEGS